jgi:hypothetical protein
MVQLKMMKEKILRAKDRLKNLWIIVQINTPKKVCWTLLYWEILRAKDRLKNLWIIVQINTPKKVCWTLLYWEINTDKFKQQASMHVNFQGAKIEYKMNNPYNSANYSKQKQLQILFHFQKWVVKFVERSSGTYRTLQSQKLWEPVKKRSC